MFLFRKRLKRFHKKWTEWYFIEWYYVPKMCVPKETKDMHIKATATIEHILRDCKCKFNSTTCNSKQKWNNKICQCECKNYRSWNLSTCIFENSKYLKCIADTSVTECDETVIAMDNLSTKKTKRKIL